jgi:competence ComEA-like helix-hairpin-helix protein
VRGRIGWQAAVVPPYSRPQLWMLLGLTLLGALGVAAGSWRRAYPDLAERVERFDAADRPAAAGPATSAGTMVSATIRRAPAPVAAWPQAGDAASTPSISARPAKMTTGEPPIDLNRATPVDLQRLPGVGPALAERIVSARQDAGRFASVDDLRRIPGIGAVKLERLRPFLSVSE